MDNVQFLERQFMNKDKNKYEEIILDGEKTENEQC